MDYITYIIVALIPALAVAFVVYTFIKNNNEKDLKHMSIQLKQERQKFFLEPRADAYQRIVLLLERINPHSLIMRLHNTNKSAIALQTELLSNIRNEFDHNVAQQIFISNSSWEMVKKSKEETIKFITVRVNKWMKKPTQQNLTSRSFELFVSLTK